MLTFYWQLLKKTPEAFRGAWETVFWIAAASLLVISLFNEPLGKQLSAEWQGISPLWPLVFITLLFAVRMARNNYEAYEGLRIRITTEQGRREARTRIRAAASNLMAQHDHFCESCRSREQDIGNIITQTDNLNAASQVFLRESLDGDESFLNLYLFASPNSYELAQHEVQHFRPPNNDPKRISIYKTLRVRRQILERCLDSHPPL